MESQSPQWTLEQLAAILGAELHGPPEHVIKRAVAVGSNDPEGITFAEGDKFLEMARQSTVGAVLVTPDSPELGRPILKVSSPRSAFATILHLTKRPLDCPKGTHPQAVVEPGAIVEIGARIHAFAFIQNGARIESEATIHPFAYVGSGCTVGAGSILYPHAVLVQDVTLGERCIVYPGAVLGSDGFGYVWDGQRHMAVPQVGGVEMGDEVHVGANTTIDRATASATIIGPGSKFDNLVQVAHNVKIGAHSIVVSQVGIAGSADIGSNVVIGAQAGISDHVKICDGVQLAGRTGVMREISEPGVYFGAPSRPFKEEMKLIALRGRLPELLDRIKKLEAEVKRLSGDV